MGSINPTAARPWWAGVRWIYGPEAPEAEGEAKAQRNKLHTAGTYRWQ